MISSLCACQGYLELVLQLGAAFQSRGRFAAEDGTAMEETRIFSLHPEGDRMVVVSYRYPAGDEAATRLRVEDHLYELLGALEPLAAPAAGDPAAGDPAAGDPAAGDPARFVRPALRALGAYHLELAPCPHKLDQNEVPFDLPRFLKRRIAERWLARDWARYPDFHADAVRAALGALHDWPTAGVLVGNGSNELLGLMFEAILEADGAVTGLEPSFGLYRMFVLRAGGTPDFLSPTDDLGLPIDRLLAAAEAHPDRPMLLCTPNNPTGAAATPAEVDALLQRLEAPLLLDNAYGEFCRHDYRPLLRRHRHLVIFRTFSKAWSLAAQRLGYLLADPSLVTELIKIKLPYNVDAASAIAAEEAVRAHASSERRVRALVGRRPQWAAMLRAFGFTVFPSEANFLLVRHPDGDDAARALHADLEARGVRWRSVGHYPGLAGCLRVSVGSGRDLRGVRAALTALMGEPIAETTA
ncbi:MAG: histidinol-phosphate transaminase [Acidobacteriota bacterium]